MASTTSDTRTGFLTIFSGDRAEVYGEFMDGSWTVEHTGDVAVNVFRGTASEGTRETFRRLNAEGIDHLAYTFEAANQVYSGAAHLLKPEGGVITIEATEPPRTQI